MVAYRKAFPKEPNLDGIMIDAYSAHKLFDLVLKSIDGLDRTVGSDPCFGCVAERCISKKGDFVAAKQFARKSA